MAIAEEESRHLTLSLSDVDVLCPVAKALSSPIRVKMLQLLHNRAMNVGELADVHGAVMKQLEHLHADG